jgi:mono/diheme cytochrome c family protein
MDNFGRAIGALLILIGLAGCMSKAAADGHSAHQLRETGDQRQFRVSCAACHGADARGNGPVASVLSVPVPDLTHIAARRNGQFPELEIFRIIDGQADLSARGVRHMPVWGYEFFGNAADDEQAHRQASEKVDRLVAYLKSIQVAD